MAADLNHIKPRSLHYEVDGMRQEFLLEDICTLGRHYENDIVLESKGVSRFHAKIICTPDSVRIVDCDSRHGLKINGEFVKFHTLQHGDRIMLQRFEIFYSEQDEEADEFFFAGNEVKFTSTQTGTDRVKIDATRKKLFQAETIDDLKQANEHLRQIQSVSADMVEVMETDKLMEKILDILCNVFGPDQAAILLLNESTGNLVPATTFPAHSGSDISVSRTITDEVQNGRIAVLSSDVHSDDRFSEAMSIINIGIGSTMCAPLIAKGVFLGVIYLISFNKNTNFSEPGLELLVGVANQAAVAIENNRLQLQISEELLLRNQLKRYVSGPLLEGLMSGEINLEPGGNKREVTCMFSDIKGFTTISESLQPETVVELLNEYFDLMVDAVFEFDGTLDKYAGDGIMAVWGSLIHVENHAESAVNAGKKMLQYISEINTRRRHESKPEFHIRIGINTGIAVCGNIGSSRRLEYTVIGDTVNTASRLETQAPDDSMLISEATYHALSQVNQARAMKHQEYSLKGKERPTPTYLIRL